jgi:type II secretory pathway pseudopilin PulG
VRRTAGRTLRRLVARARRAAAAYREERGAGLVEALVAVAIAGIALVVLLQALSVGSVAVVVAEERVTAENLARSQLEDVKRRPYLPAPASYPTVTPDAGYAVSAQATVLSGGDGDVQLITVLVTRAGATLMTVQGYRVNR